MESRLRAEEAETQEHAEEKNQCVHITETRKIPKLEAPRTTEGGGEVKD